MAKKKSETAITTSPREYADTLIKAKAPAINPSDVGLPTFPVATRSEIARLFAEYDMEPPVAPIQEGAIVHCKLIGPGAPVEAKDPETGEARPLGTWVVEVQDGIRIRIISSHQLDVYFGPNKDGSPSKYIGRVIALVKGGKVDTGKGGRQVRDWLVGTPKEA